MTAQRRDRAINSIGVWLLSAVLLVWTLLPIYNIIRVSIQEKEEVLSTSVFPIAPSSHSFRRRVPPGLLAAGDILEPNGKQILYVVVVAFLVLAIGSLTVSPSAGCASAAVGCYSCALLTYVIPMSFHGHPVLLHMAIWLTNNPLAVIAVEVPSPRPMRFSFSSNTAHRFRSNWMRRRASTCPPLQIFFRIYLPLMAPPWWRSVPMRCCCHGRISLCVPLLLRAGKVITVPVALGKCLGRRGTLELPMAAAISRHFRLAYLLRLSAAR